MNVKSSDLNGMLLAATMKSKKETKPAEEAGLSLWTPSTRYPTDSASSTVWVLPIVVFTYMLTEIDSNVDSNVDSSIESSITDSITDISDDTSW